MSDRIIRSFGKRTVPAGPFELRDVSPLYDGNMDIEIHEADGSVRHLSQNSATVPVLQREGRLRYGLSLGRYRSSIGQGKGEAPKFFKVQLPGDEE